MTLTRQMRQKTSFSPGDLYNMDGELIKSGMLKHEARVFFRGLRQEDANELRFIWIPRDREQDDLSWYVVNHGS